MENIIQLKPNCEPKLSLHDVIRKLNKVEFILNKTLASISVFNKRKIQISNSDGIHIVNLEDLIQVKAEGNYSIVIVQNEAPILVSKPLKHFFNSLPKTNFWKAHQSHLINADHISKVSKKGGTYIRLSNGDFVPISRSASKDIFIKISSKFPA